MYVVAKGFALNPSDRFLRVVVLFYLKSFLIQYCYNHWIMVYTLPVLLMYFNLFCWVKIMKIKKKTQVEFFPKNQFNQKNKKIEIESSQGRGRHYEAKQLASNTQIRNGGSHSWSVIEWVRAWPMAARCCAWSVTGRAHTTRGCCEAEVRPTQGRCTAAWLHEEIGSWLNG